MLGAGGEEGLDPFAVVGVGCFEDAGVVWVYLGGVCRVAGLWINGVAGGA